MQKPYFERNGIAIYHGDSRELLPQMPQSDLVITDPPYGMSYQSGWRAVKYNKIIGDSDLPLDLIAECIQKAIAAAYVFCRWDNIPDMPTPRSVIAWVKNNWSAGDLKHEHGRQWEACCFYPQSQHKFEHRTPDVIVEPKTQNKLHPTQKPVRLIERLISANKCQTILDPFMGSGTTLVAALRLGKTAIGIEASEKYCEVAANRFAQLTLDFGPN